MHTPLSFTVLVALLTLVISASASPLVSVRENSKCSARDIATVRRTVSDEIYFCKWWLSDDRTRTPFLEFSPAKVTNLCKCIAPVSTKKTVTKPKRAEPTTSSGLEKRQTVASCRVEMSLQFTQPWKFCTFYNAYPRTTSPFARYSAKDLVKLCRCVEGKAVSTTTSKTSTKRASTSTTKVSIKPSSKTTSNISSTKLSSTSTKSLTSTTSSRAVSKTSTKTSSSSSKISSKSSSKSSSKAHSSSSNVAITSAKSSSKVSLQTSSRISSTTTTSSKTSSSTSSSTSKVAAITSSKLSTTSLSSSRQASSTSIPTSSLRVSSSRVASSSATRSSTVSFSTSSAPTISISVSISLPSISISSSSTSKALSSISETASSIVEATSSTESSASPTTTSSTSSAAPFSTGVLMAKGGVVDGLYWNTERDSSHPAFSQSLVNRVSCSLRGDRVLRCNDLPVNILGYDNHAELVAESGDIVGPYTLMCDRASDGLLTCDPITFKDITSRGPFSTCDVDYGATLNYLEDSAQTLYGCSRIDGLYLVSSETSSTPSTTSSLAESSTPVVTTPSSTAPIPSGFLMAKGGPVDGQYWNYGINAQYPAFSSSLTDRVSCSLDNDRVLKCNNIPANIYTGGLYAELVPDSGVSTSTLKCDRALDGLLTCDSIYWGGEESHGPFATCPTSFGNTLHYWEGNHAEGCTLIDGLYLDPPPGTPSTPSVTTSLAESSTPSVTTSLAESSTPDVTTSSLTESSTPDVTISSASEFSSSTSETASTITETASMTTEIASLTEVPAPTDVTSTSTTSAAPTATGYIYARGGNVDNQIWNTDQSTRVPKFSAASINRVLCTLGPDRILTCNNLPVSIYGPGLYAQTIQGLSIGPYTLRCDRADDGLLTCDPIKYGNVASNGPFGTCITGFGTTLHYLTGSIFGPSCTPIDGLYLS